VPPSNIRTTQPTQDRADDDEAILARANYERLRRILNRNLSTASETALVIRLRAALDRLSAGRL
jgi:hypothetical protein